MADVATYLLGVAGLAASITLIFLGMRAVMDVGGFCAEGGPYVIDTHCPEGVVPVMMLAFPALFLFGGMMVWKGSRLGGYYAALPLLAWPALFLSLGWNFIEYSLPTAQHGLELGWLMPGLMFVAMGIVPLLIVLPAVGLRGPADPDKVESMRRTLQRAQARPPSTTRASRASSLSSDGRDLVDELERLAELRERGALTEAEFEAAKSALLPPAGAS
jgi:hypothetical protein